MRISDWSSDVCSSDLALVELVLGHTDREVVGIPALEAVGGRLHPIVEQRRPERDLPCGVRGVDGQLPVGHGRLLVGVESGAVKLGEGERTPDVDGLGLVAGRSEEHTSELQSLMRISYAVFCLQKKKTIEKRRL